MFYLAAAAATAAVVTVSVAATVTVVASEGENYEDRDDDPDKALVVVEKSAKAVVIHGRPPKDFFEEFCSSIIFYVVSWGMVIDFRNKL